MPVAMGANRILVKAPAGLAGASLAVGGGSAAFTVEPLFTSIAQPSGLAAAAASVWQVLTPNTTALAGASPWDVCHQLLDGGFGLAGAPPVEFAEPDFQQRWIAGQEAQLGMALERTGGSPAPQDSRFPGDPDPLWFHNSAHAQFDAALTSLGQPPDGETVRVAHLDTGYDPAHRALPAHLNTHLQRNFVDADRPDDASDDTTGPFTNLGHGTGTLGVLAGKALPGAQAIGAAPFVEVVPIRVANRVVLFENSAIARALDYVHQLCATPATRVHVITMSMGGLASQAWAEAVNALYEAGVFIVTAAGNNFGNLPTRNIVFPARFNRVVAACGVMADHSPYADLGAGEMAGNYGPESKMRTALAAFTPNTPWARLGSLDIIDHNGAGTSSATPQVAAAAALWIQRNKAAWDAYPQGWMQVEAVRKALFESAKDTDREHLGRGDVRALDALNHPPAQNSELTREAPDSAAFPFLRLLLGIGVAAPDPRRQRMLELEALQLSQSTSVERILPDPEIDPSSVSPATLSNLADALAEHPQASQALRDAIHRSTVRRVFPAAPADTELNAVQRLHLRHATNPELPPPPRRRLRVYAYDPSLGTQLDTLGINETVLDVPWEEELQPGPVGKYVEVIDVDPASGCCYAPVDLNHPHVLAQNGLAPSETRPQFHQQMTYAVVMKTIDHFEGALGRVALWAPHYTRDPDGTSHEEFVERLRIYPHALRAANSFYSPNREALLLGYFEASKTDAVDVLPGGLVFSALSHDVIAHETTHALLDGLHRRFREATNDDVLAFHEAFADIVALFQHFTVPAALRQQIARARGDLGQETLLAQLAVQFGHATGQHGALRDAIGTDTSYEDTHEPHERGAVLVAAVFDAFLQIYRQRTTDLYRLATGGTGVLPDGAISVDLVERLAQEASKVAAHVLGICIRALDYCPPVDPRFGEYLRALITADRDLVPDDQRSYRVAFVSAFRKRGIYPVGVKSLSADTLVWEPPPIPLKNIRTVLGAMSLDWDLASNRRHAYEQSRANAVQMHDWLVDPEQVSDDEIGALGFVRLSKPTDWTVDGIAGKLGGIEVHSVRPARRVGPDGQQLSDLVVEITQTFRPQAPAGGAVRGGCTLLIDLQKHEVRYFIRKRISARRFSEQQKVTMGMEVSNALWSAYSTHLGEHGEPFAVLHRPW